MTTPVPADPKIYHIVHVDRLPSIITEGGLWCDSEIAQRKRPGSVIGMNNIKQRRLNLRLSSRPDLYVGNCVPFYFCPRSIMLYMIHIKSPDLSYTGGQETIVHLEAYVKESVSWAEQNETRWAFTSSNAGACTFDDYCDLGELNKIDWTAVQAKQWVDHKYGKQAEFLLESYFPWELIKRIGVYSESIYCQAVKAFLANSHRPQVKIIKAWYY